MSSYAWFKKKAISTAGTLELNTASALFLVIFQLRLAGPEPTRQAHNAIADRLQKLERDFERKHMTGRSHT